MPDSRVSGRALGLQTPRQSDQFVELVEADLGPDLPTPDPQLHLVAERRLELFLGVVERFAQLGIECRPAAFGCPSSSWLASQLGPVLGLADRPAPGYRVACEAPAHVVAAHL